MNLISAVLMKPIKMQYKQIIVLDFKIKSRMILTITITVTVTATVTSLEYLK